MDDELLESILATVKKQKKVLDIEQIEKAYWFAKEAHNGQMRHSGQPYITHPAEVAKILIELGMDTQSVEAGLLHDVIEDTSVTLETIEKEFSKEVAYLVSGVTKLSNMKYNNKMESRLENIRRMFLAMSQDIRVIIIKLADRLHNLRTIKYIKYSKQLFKAHETMEIYAPIAHRLGIRWVKEELEDISIKILDPHACYEIEKYLSVNQKTRQKLIEGIKKEISARLIQENIKYAIEGRVKSIYGIYRKAFVGNKRFEEIYDIYAVRIILNTEIECYNMLGIAHDMFRPLPNRFKDYISTPKANMYQSLHTTVVNSNEIPFEIQIRTWGMHYTAEYGIAAHWKYKLGIKEKKDDLNKRLSWIRQLLEIQKESGLSDTLVSSIKSDFIPEEVYILTPRGDVKSLPNGSTTIDFAYSIHTQIGHHMIGAKVDGKTVPIDYVVKTGEIVKIITSEKSNGPSRDWLKIVKSSEARSKIKSWFKSKHKEENIQNGKAAFLKELKKNTIDLASKELESYIQEVAKNYGLNDSNEFFAALGYGGIFLTSIVPKLKEIYLKNYKKEIIEKCIIKQNTNKHKVPDSKVVVENLESCLTKLSKCCNPLPGDEIIGFVTRGYGVSIHRRDCQNVIIPKEANQQSERWVKAKWNLDKPDEYFSTSIEVLVNNKTGTFASVVEKIETAKLIIHGINAKEPETQKSLIKITLNVKNLEQLNKLLHSIEALPDVIFARRYTNKAEQFLRSE